MKIHRLTFKLSFLIALSSFAISLCLCDSAAVYDKWIENISIGFFASSVLLMFSSLVAYAVEEEKSCSQYYWKLIELRSKVLVLSTIPQNNGTWINYYEGTVEINCLLIGYFATFDQDFILCKRKKIQKIFEIHHALYTYKNYSLDAELYIRQYMNDKLDECGEKIYKKDKLREDIKDYVSATDNFMTTGKPFVMYLDEKIKELQKMIAK